MGATCASKCAPSSADDELVVTRVPKKEALHGDSLDDLLIKEEARSDEVDKGQTRPSKQLSQTSDKNESSPKSESTRMTSGSSDSCLTEGLAEMGDVASAEGPELEVALEEIRAMCREARLFDAMKALLRLEESLEAHRRCGEESPVAARVAKELSEDETFATLRATHARMVKEFGIAGDMPNGTQDNRWVSTTVTDHTLGEDFSIDINIRWATGGERDRNGPSAQLIACGFMHNFPMDVEKFTSVYRETDLYQKEWMPDCESCTGGVAGVEKLYSSWNHVVTSSPMLPVKFDIVAVREFAVCPSGSPVGGDLGPGLLIVDTSPPANVTSYAGWDLPTPVQRSTRLTGIGMVLYFTPSRDRPGCCDAFVLARCAAAIPQWLLPLTLLKKFLAHHFLSTFKSNKVQIGDSWDTLRYQDRIDKDTDFYGSARRSVQR